jgi:hypothetical protein
MIDAEETEYGFDIYGLYWQDRSTLVRNSRSGPIWIYFAHKS